MLPLLEQMAWSVYVGTAFLPHSTAHPARILLASRSIWVGIHSPSVVLPHDRSDPNPVGDASTLKSSQTYTVGNDISSQQSGIVYANPTTLISVSLSGTLNLFDTRQSPSSKWRKLHGPTKAITASFLTGQKEKTFYTGSFDGTMKAFDVGGELGEKEGECRDVEGSGHTAQVVGIAGEGGKVVSTGWDDKVAEIQGSSFV
jgi:WD40 repeat protein